MRSLAKLFGLGAVLVVVAGCGGSDNERVVEDAQGQNCSATKYTPFAAANHAAQDERTAAQLAIADKAEEALADPASAAAVFAEIEAIYSGTAELAAKVRGRADDHFPDDPAAAVVGQTIDDDITAAIARGKAATTAVEIDIAKQIVDKSLTRFFYLSVYHELVEGERGTYDEAYGYLGTGPDNAEANLRSIALIARARDEANGTTLSDELFEEILEGSCALDKRLTADGTEKLTWSDDADYAKEVGEIDERMQKTLALSVGHELFELSADPDEAKVELYEGAYFFYALEAAMRAKGGQAEVDAGSIRTMFDEAIEAVEAADPDWQDGFDPEAIKAGVGAAFEVTIKG